MKQTGVASTAVRFAGELKITPPRFGLGARAEVERCFEDGAGGAIAQQLAAEGNVDALVLIGSVAAAPQLREAQSRISERDIPIFLLWGEDDAVVPAAEAERLSDRLPTSTLAFVPGESLACTLSLPAHQPHSTERMLLLECKVRIIRVEAPDGDGLYGIGCRIEDYCFLHIANA